MQFQILDSLAINAQPLFDIGVFGAGVTVLNFDKPILINPGENRTERQSKNRTLRPAPAAAVRFPTHEFREFPEQLHVSAPAISRSSPGPR
jgi:hypothetical protein